MAFVKFHETLNNSNYFIINLISFVVDLNPI